MFLKRLEIQGFKSFAGRTILEFLPPKNGRFSITAVVGPNGSGKSNIVDAIRWAMGEQSMKMLRGKKSEDIIFAGSETKGGVGMAEVNLILDNADGKMEIDCPEITVTRRLYKSGEGEYLVNGAQARLLDVRLLLAKAQFAETSYSIVGQGTIEDLLTLNPAGRKEFLDEAVGIKEFQIKQHQANLKLERTSDNMSQVDGLLREIEPRLRILSRQVKKLEKRREVELELRESQEKYYSAVFLNNKKEADALNAELSEVEKKYRSCFEESESIKKELAELVKTSPGKQEIFQKWQLEYQTVLSERNEIERQLAVKSGQLQTEYARLGKQNVIWLENKILELQKRAEQLDAESSLALTEKEKWAKAIAGDEKTLEETENICADKKRKIIFLQNQTARNQTEQNFWQFSGLSAVRSVLENRRSLGQVHGMVAELGEVADEYELAMEIAAGSYLSALAVEDEDTARAAVEYLRQNRLGAATFLPLTKIRRKEINEETKSLLNISGVIGFAVDLIKYSPKFADVFSFVFGDTLIVEDFASAQRVGVGRARMVTLAGDLFEKSGVIKGGYRERRKNGLSFSKFVFAGREQPFEDLQAQIKIEEESSAGLARRAEEIKNSLSEEKNELNKVNLKIEMLEREKGNVSSEMLVLQADLRSSQIKPEEYDEFLLKLKKEKEELQKQLSVFEKNINELSDKISELNKEEEEKKQRAYFLQDEMQAKQTALNEILARRNELKINMARIETKQESVEKEAEQEMGATVKSVLERNPQIADGIKIEELEILSSDTQKLKYQLSLIGGIDPEAMKEYEETKERFEFLSGQMEDLAKATADLRKMIAELDELMKNRRKEAFKKISKEFDHYFKILFSGGKAEIKEIYDEPEEDAVLDGSPAEGAAEVVEENKEKIKKENILTGIDVIVSLPGKKIKYINTLSGGERTLTSIALICAVLNFNPSPFIILDEVEAALDEANTMRFVEIMRELACKSQFIVITHNRATMHAADVLYGVVINGAEGASKLLSVKMEEAEKYEQANIDKK
ncbi:MAG: AAA family ATPase [Patescibacteria group bacterium]|nr:AAA family ATPase [Patescibacteria group bacterium]